MSRSGYLLHTGACILARPLYVDRGLRENGAPDSRVTVGIPLSRLLLRADDASPDGVHEELDAIVDAQFFHEMGAVVVNRVFA